MRKEARPSGGGEKVEVDVGKREIGIKTEEERVHGTLDLCLGFNKLY